MSKPSRAAAPRPRIFQVGFNRCGTKSLADFFERNGLSSVHWKGGALAAAIELARREGRPLLHYVDDYDVYTDMEMRDVPKVMSRLIKGRILRRLSKKLDPEKDRSPIYAFKYFRQLDDQYPRSKFILNTRDVDRWVASRLRFNNATYRSCIHGDNFHDNQSDLTNCWKEEWDAHHADVKAYFEGRPQDLLVFDIEKDGVDRLIGFFESTRLDARHWSKLNASK
jgi:hypothetical protein